MSENIMNWFVDTMARTETLDLYFVVSDLVDIPQNEMELSEGAYGDALAEQSVREIRKRKNTPLGKLVI
jgi:hypothetical protein